MKKNSLIIVFISLAILVVSCSEYSRKPGRVYAPDMVYSRAVDYYNGTEKIEADSGSYNKMPVPGTVAREQQLPDHIGANDSALAKVNMPKFDLSDKDVETGKRLYLIHCAICHGEAMDGNGPLYASGKFAAMPANLKLPKFLAYTPGEIYHTIVYGKNVMGSYASQLDTKQRWQVIAYIKKVQSGETGGSAFTMVKGSAVPKDSVAVSKKEEPKNENKH
jgi:mono/diheme cytochrome c family protein